MHRTIMCTEPYCTVQFKINLASPKGSIQNFVANSFSFRDGSYEALLKDLSPKLYLNL